jgi:uncharacterized protein (DUF1778 family)
VAAAQLVLTERLRWWYLEILNTAHAQVLVAQHIAVELRVLRYDLLVESLNTPTAHLAETVLAALHKQDVLEIQVLPLQ